MTTGADDPIFVDTDALVFATVPETLEHPVASATIQSRLNVGAELWVSRQIIREFLATLTRPQRFGAPIPVPLLAIQVQFLERRFRVADEGPEVTSRLLRLMQSVAVGGKQVHEANIVATMQVYGVRRLLTANVADFTRFSELIDVIPLVGQP